MSTRSVCRVGISRSAKCRLLAFGIAFYGLGCGDGARLSKDEDAFLSYVQSAKQLAQGLVDVKTHDEFIGPLKFQPPTPQEAKGENLPVRTMKEMLDSQCTGVEGYRIKVSKLTPDVIEQLRLKHQDIGKNLDDLVEVLAKRHAASPDILGDDWQRYWQVLRLLDDGE